MTDLVYLIKLAALGKEASRASFMLPIAESLNLARSAISPAVGSLPSGLRRQAVEAGKELSTFSKAFKSFTARGIRGKKLQVIGDRLRAVRANQANIRDQVRGALARPKAELATSRKELEKMERLGRIEKQKGRQIFGVKPTARDIYRTRLESRQANLKARTEMAEAQNKYRKVTTPEASKEKLPWSLAKKLGLTVAGGAALAGTGIATQYGLEALSRTGKEKAFKSMLEEDRELKRMHTATPVRVRKHFETLFRFNPEMAKDPLVASSFVKGTSQHDFLAHKTVGELLAARKAQLSTRSEKFPALPSFKIDND